MTCIMSFYFGMLWIADDFRMLLDVSCFFVAVVRFPHEENLTQLGLLEEESQPPGWIRATYM